VRGNRKLIICEFVIWVRVTTLTGKLVRWQFRLFLVPREYSAIWQSIDRSNFQLHVCLKLK